MITALTEAAKTAVYLIGLLITAVSQPTVHEAPSAPSAPPAAVQTDGCMDNGGCGDDANEF